MSKDQSVIKHVWRLGMCLLACAVAGCSTLVDKKAEGEFPYELLWTRTLGGYPLWPNHEPLNGTVFVYCEKENAGAVVICDPDGSIRRIQLPSDVAGWIGGLAVPRSSSVMYVRVVDSDHDPVPIICVYAIDYETQKVRWKSRLDAYHTEGDILVCDNVIAVTDGRGVRFLRREDGGRLWTYDDPDGIDGAGTGCRDFEYRDGVLYFSDKWSAMYALDLRQRRLLWKRQLPAYSIGQSLLHEQRLYYFYLGRKPVREVFQCYDWRTGKLLWNRSFPHYGGGSYMPRYLCVVGGEVFHATDTHLVGHNALTGEQTVSWPFGADSVYRGLAAVNGVVVVASNEQGVFAVDPKSGRVKWRYRCKGMDMKVSDNGQWLLLYSGDKTFWLFRAKSATK